VRGASGFLLKDAPADDLISATRLVASGDALLAPAITRRVIEEFARRAPAVSDVPVSHDILSPREMDVLHLLAQGRANSQISTELFIGEATVKTHVSRVLTKLGLSDRVHAVIYAYETGLVKPSAGGRAVGSDGR